MSNLFLIFSKKLNPILLKLSCINTQNIRVAELKKHSDINAMEITSNHLIVILLFLIGMKFCFLSVEKNKYGFQVYTCCTIKSRMDVTLIYIV